MNSDAASTIGKQGSHSTLAGCLGQGQSLVFTYGTINFIMGWKKSHRKIESKQPDIKLPPNIDIFKLGIESKQGVTCIIMYLTEMFEKKDGEIKELEANVSMLETRVVKLEQQIDKNSTRERKNTLIMAGTIPPAQHAEDYKFVVSEHTRKHQYLELSIENILI